MDLRTHTQTPLFALNLGGELGCPQYDPKNLKGISQLYHNPEFSEPSSVALDLQNSAHSLYRFCMQTLQSSEPELQRV